MHTHARIMTNVADVARFLLAGHATITLKSLATNAHFTYRISKADDADRWFVKVLTDGDQYVYAGMLFDATAALSITKASRFRDDSPCVKAFRYFHAHLLAGSIPEQLEVRHEGQCGRCGRALTHPDSIDRGIGPDCWEMMGGTRAMVDSDLGF
jgi:hypothetical protein